METHNAQTYTLRILAILCLILALWRDADGQYYMPSTEPSSLPRKELRDGPFRIIYPAYADSLALETAHYARYLSARSRLSDSARGSFRIVLRNETSIPNGMVAWTPARSELYSRTAGFDEIPVPWRYHLISHEIRHYAQLQALGQGTLWFLHFLMGEQSAAVGSALVPVWFMEGDAIYNESRLGRYGRANMATTYQAYRANLLSGVEVSYDQYINRSYRRFIPNHYHFGSLMVEYGTHAYGEDLWRYALRYTGKFPFTLFPFHFAIKRRTGLTRHQLFDTAYRRMDSLFRAGYDPRVDPEPQPEEEWENEYHPHLLAGGSLLAYWQQAWHAPLRLYVTDQASGDTHALFTPRNLSGPVAYDEELAFVTQYVQHPIWGDFTWSDLWRIDLLSGESERITYNLQSFGPRYNPSDSTVLLISTERTGGDLILKLCPFGVMDILDTARLPGTYELRELSVDPRNQRTIIRAVEPRGTFLMSYSWEDQRMDTIMAPILVDMANLVPTWDGILFTATHSYAKRVMLIPWSRLERDEDGTPPMVDSVELLHIRSYGVEEMEVQGDSALLLSEYTVGGYRVARIPRPESHTVAMPVGGSRLYPLPDSLTEREPFIPEASAPADEDPQVRPYKRFRGGARVHSWLPFYSKPVGGLTDLLGARPGVSILSQNAIGSLAFQLGVLYDGWDWGSGVSVTYKGGIPHISLNVEYLPEEGGRYLYSRKFQSDLTFYIPMAFNLGAGLVGFLPQAEVGLLDRLLRNDDGEVVTGTLRGSMAYGGTLWAQTRTGSRDLYPEWGFSLGFLHQFTEHLKTGQGQTFSTQVHFYLPGVVPGHSLRLSGMAFGQARSYVMERRKFPNPDLMAWCPPDYTTGFQSLSARLQYTFPLGHPDANWASWIYFKRFYSTLGCNWQTIEHEQGLWKQILSVSIQVKSDIHLFRTQYPLTVGIKLAYSPLGNDLGLWGHPFSVRLSTGIALPFRMDQGERHAWW